MEEEEQRGARARWGKPREMLRTTLRAAREDMSRGAAVIQLKESVCTELDVQQCRSGL